MADKILVDEELLRAAFRMVGNQMDHHSRMARRYEIEQPTNWLEKSNKHLLKAAEAAEIYHQLADALEA